MFHTKNHVSSEHLFLPEYGSRDKKESWSGSRPGITTNTDKDLDPNHLLWSTEPFCSEQKDQVSSPRKTTQVILTFSCFLSLCCHSTHQRRRMELEDKAKVVASFLGAECVQFLAALAVLPRSVGKKRMNSTVSSKATKAQQLTQQGIDKILTPIKRDDLCLVV